MSARGQEPGRQPAALRGPACQGGTQVQGHDPRQPQSAGGAQSAGAGFHRHGAEPEVGERHHLYRHRQRLALLGGRGRPILPPGDGLGHGGAYAAKLVCDAWQLALWRRNRPRGVIAHSDRGSQYCSGDYQRLLRGNGLVCSMSKKGDCYDHAAMESWNHSKVETIHGERFVTRQTAKDHVFKYIEVDYNRKRLHSRLGYLSPEALELRHVV